MNEQKKTDTKKKVFLFGCLPLIIIVVIIAMIFPKSAEADNKNEGAKVEAPKSLWEYSREANQMGDSVITAAVKSKDVLDFKFPYNGGAESYLMIRKQKKNVDIVYNISKGQITSASIIKGGTVRVKFDDNAPFKVSCNIPSDGSNDYLFLGSEAKLLSNLKKSKKMVIEVEFFREGVRQISFETEGLIWK